MKEERIPVFLSSDNNYVPYMSALMVSIMDNTKAEVDFYIVDAGISEFNKKCIASLQEKWGFGLEFIKAEPYRHLFKAPTTPHGHITQASSDRFLIPYMKPELDKAIILDVDMIALGDIQKLWNIDLESKVLASVPVYCWINKSALTAHVRDTGMHINHQYLNMGTLLVDCKKWREEKMLDRLSAIEMKFDPTQYPWWDEIYLNLALQDNNYKILDPKFNMMIPHQCYYSYGKPDFHKEIITDYLGLDDNYKIDEIIFSHFAMKDVKPWNTNMYLYNNKWVEIPTFKVFWYYMKMTPFYEGEMMAFLLKKDLREKNMQNQTKDIYAMKKYQKKYQKYQNLNKMTFGLIPSFREKMKKYKSIIE